MNILHNFTCSKLFSVTFFLLTSWNCVTGHFMPGPTCTVTSMIPGSSSVTTAMEGTCQSILACRGIGGVPIGKCGLTNVCCICK